MATEDAGLGAALAEAAGARLAAAGVPGAAVCVLVDGKPVLEVGSGHRDVARTEPLGAEERLSLYSITKILIAVAALRLVEAGRLGLDGPIRATVPEVDLPDDVTLRRLLNHTAGLPDYGAMPEYNADLKADPGAPWTPAEFLARTLPRGPLFPPGEGWAYSNVGYLLVRLAIERVTGRTLGEALAGFVFRPLGLRRTAVAATLADTVDLDLAPGWSAELDGDGAPHDISRRYHPGWVSHGLVVSTAGETAAILEGLFGGRLVSPESLAAMRQGVPVPGKHPLIAQPGYGLGLMVDLGSPFGPVAGHGGGGPGYATAAFHFPDIGGRRVTSVALANRDAGEVAMEIVFALARTAGERLG